MFGIIAYLVCEIWFVIRRKQTEWTWFEKGLLMLFTLAGTLFFLMFVSDDYSQYIPMPVLLTVAAVGGFLLFAIYIKSTGGKQNGKLLSAILSGVICAYGIGLVICVPSQGNTALGGIAQDGMMTCVVVFFAIGMPCVYISLMNTLDFVTVIGGCGLIGAAFPPVGFCMKNNVEHMVRQSVRL